MCSVRRHLLQWVHQSLLAFQDEAVADYFERMVDQGLQPEQFARVWLHTHPGSDVTPSVIDEATFARVFGRNDWAVMGILARNDRAYARLQYRVGPGGSWEIPVRVDFSRPFSGSDPAAWETEYLECVMPQLHAPSFSDEMRNPSILEPSLQLEREDFLWP
jgi:hypothetical protein